MKLGFDGNTSIESTGGKYINITPENAVSKGRFIKELSFNSEDNYLEVVIENSEGQTASKRYYTPQKGGFIKTDEDLEKATTKLVKIIANIVRLYCPKDTAIEGETFKELCEASIKKINEVNPEFSKKELWVKLIYNNKDFTTLPGYAPIALPASLSEEEVKKYGLVIRPEYNDVVEKAPVVPDTDVKEDPLGGLSNDEAGF